jgi:hypothetical protein
MSMTNARILQLTNTNIGAITTNSNMPLGVTTVIYPFDTNNCYPTYTVSSSNSDTLVINKSGVYNLVYNASVVATEAGNVTLALKVNGITKYTVTETATVAGSVNLTIPYEIYVPCNCQSAPNNVPAYIQVQSTGVALTSGTANLIVSKE